MLSALLLLCCSAFALPAKATVVINEVNTGQPGPDTKDFIELISNEANASLDEYTLVLFDGNSGSSYMSFSLMGRRTRENRMFVIGMLDVAPKPDIAVNSQHPLLRNGDQLDNADAIALYKTKSTEVSFPNKTAVTNVNLVDAVVYSKFAPTGNDRFLQILKPMSGQIHELSPIINGRAVDLSITRCPIATTNSVNATYELVLSLPTPGMPNNCSFRYMPHIGDVPCPLAVANMSTWEQNPPPVSHRLVVINEINSDTPEIDTDEFVELYDGGRGGTLLTGLALVFFDGSKPQNPAYGVIDLHGQNTDARGYFVVGTDRLGNSNFNICDHFIQNGPDAVGLFSADNLSSWSIDSLPTTRNLLDAVVYSRGKAQDHDLLQALLPGQYQLREKDPEMDRDHDVSLSRCSSNMRLTQSAFILAEPTPGEPNNCTSTGDEARELPNVILSEICILQGEQFVEISDFGNGYTFLSGLSLWIINEQGLRSSMDLSHFNTDKHGFFSIAINDLIDLEDEYSKVLLVQQHGAAQSEALNDSSAWALPPDTLVIDSVVLSEEGVFSNLMPLNIQSSVIHINTTFNQSLSRCFGTNQSSPEQFLFSDPTPGWKNSCPVVMINEINSDTHDIQTGAKTKATFIELYDGGYGRTSLNGYQLVMYEADNVPYSCIMLAGYATGNHGYFTIGQKGVTPSPSFAIDDAHMFFPSGKNSRQSWAVALIHTPRSIPCGSLPLNKGLVDAVAFSTTPDSFLGQLRNLAVKHGAGAFYENPFYLIGDETISRCSKNQTVHDVTVFTLTPPTPGAPNDCTRTTEAMPFQDIVINEVDARQIRGTNDAAEFVELYDGGIGNKSLSGLILVFFNGAYMPPSAYLVLNLTGYETNGQGFFVIGQEKCQCKPTMILNYRFLQNGPDAIVLYQVHAVSDVSSLPVHQNIVDVVVYTRRQQLKAPPSLLSLLWGEAELVEQAISSLSRCFNMQPRNMSAFKNAPPSPNAENICTRGNTIGNGHASSNTNVTVTSMPTDTRIHTTTLPQNHSHKSTWLILLVVTIFSFILFSSAAFFVYRWLCHKKLDNATHASSLAPETSKFSVRAMSEHPYDLAPLPPTDDNIALLMEPIKCSPTHSPTMELTNLTV